MGHSASRSCCLFFWSDGAWRHSPQQVGLYLSLLAWTWEAWGGATPGYSQFPKQSLLLGRAWSYAQPWLWINLPACVQHRTPRALYRFAQGAASSAWLSLGLSADGLPSSQELSAVLWSVAAGRHCPQWIGLWLSILLQCGQTRVLGQQNSFEDLNQRDLDSTVSPGQTAPQLGSAGEQSHWFGLLLGHCRYELDLPCSVCWLLQAHLLLFCHSHIPSLWALQIPLKPPWGRPE